MKDKVTESILPETVIKQKKKKALEKEDMLYFFFKVFVVIIIAIVLLRSVYGIEFVEGQNMYPSIKDGDVVVYFRINSQYQNSEVISFRKDVSNYIGRIVAQAGDIVEITEEGDLIVNGNVQQEDIYFDTYPDNASGITFPYVVDKDCVFVLGDYRTNAVDSRHFGQVSLKEINGKVISIIRRRGF